MYLVPSYTNLIKKIDSHIFVSAQLLKNIGIEINAIVIKRSKELTGICSILKYQYTEDQL